MSNYPIRYLVVHASATFPSMTHVDVHLIRQWHLDRGWRDVGYHYIIKRDGTVQKGREDDVVGAHVGGANTNTLGICLVGGLKENTQIPEDNFTKEQWHSLNHLLDDLLDSHPDAQIKGHNEFPNHRSRGCPCFDISSYREWFNEMRHYNALGWQEKDWHHTTPSDFKLPKTFWQEVDFKKERTSK